jgi:hypothetical protein
VVEWCAATDEMPAATPPRAVSTNADLRSCFIDKLQMIIK